MIDPNRTGLASVNRICGCTRLLPTADKPITSGKWDHSTLFHIGNRKAHRVTPRRPRLSTAILVL